MNTPRSDWYQLAYRSSGVANATTASTIRHHPTRLAIRKTTAGTTRNIPTERVSPEAPRSAPAPTAANTPGLRFQTSSATAATTSASNSVSAMKKDSRST